MKTANIHYRPQRSWGKVTFSQASVILSTGGRAWLPGGMPGCQGSVCGCWGVCVVARGACMVAREGECVVKGGGHVWQRRGMHGRGGHA